jgi:hypothetical protein
MDAALKLIQLNEPQRLQQCLISGFIECSGTANAPGALEFVDRVVNALAERTPSEDVHQQFVERGL